MNEAVDCASRQAEPARHSRQGTAGKAEQTPRARHRALLTCGLAIDGIHLVE
jgi:hypothetical protein